MASSQQQAPADSKKKQWPRARRIEVIQRLLSMGLLEAMDDAEDALQMFKLGCKNARDWRFRQSGRQRRSRLVAKEFTFLQPFMENLYSPASLRSTQRLLAGLCRSDARLCFYRGDIKDAFWKQRRKTYTVATYLNLPKPTFFVGSL